MQWVGRWWRQPDHFDWLSGYLQTRGMATAMRRGLALVAASLALVPVNALWGPASIDDRLAVSLALVASLAGLSAQADLQDFDNDARSRTDPRLQWAH